MSSNALSRALFPDHLRGRASTTVNLAQVLGAAILPALTGLVVRSFPAAADGARPELACRLAFGTLAVALVLGLAAYLPRTTQGRAM